MRIVINGYLCTLGERWTCAKNAELETDLNEKFGWEWNTPNMPHILYQAAYFYKAIILDHPAYIGDDPERRD